MEIIKVRCPSCKAVMKAKAEYAGRVLKCPACKTPFIVPKADGDGLEPPIHILMKLADMEAQKQAQAEEEAAIPHVEIVEVETIQRVEHPQKLNRMNRYIILDPQRLLAYWDMKKGWQLATTAGSLVPVRGNMEMLPTQGDFRLVELFMQEQDGISRVTALHIYQLARQYSLTKLQGDENAVLSTITTTVGLGHSQKKALMQALKTNFPRAAWAENKTIYDYLLGDDFHSSVIGENGECSMVNGE